MYTRQKDLYYTCDDVIIINSYIHKNNVKAVIIFIIGINPLQSAL